MSKSLKRNNTKSFFKRSRKNKLGGSGIDALISASEHTKAANILAGLSYMPVRTPIRHLNPWEGHPIYKPGDDVWAMSNLGNFLNNVPPAVVGFVLLTFAFGVPG